MTTPPERIYHWAHTQLSVAKYYGRIRYLEHEYMIAYDEEGQPLVRDDVIKRDRKERRKAAKVEAKPPEAGLFDSSAQAEWMARGANID